MLCCKDQITFAKIVELSLTQHPAAIEGQKSLFSFSLPKKTFAVPFELQRRCVTQAEYNARIAARTYKK